jgi:hypothetical protein
MTGLSATARVRHQRADRRPSKGFTRGIALKGYSEEGKIYVIEDSGLIQEGIPYHYWESPSPDYIKFLRFTFGSRFETLQKQSP